MDVETGNRLAEYRKKFGLSQEELADRLGVSRQAVSKWERCESSPDTDNLIALSKLYGITLDELLNSDPKEGLREKPGKEEVGPSMEQQTKEEEETKGKKKPSININGTINLGYGGDQVHIAPDGIHIKDGEDEIHIAKDGIHISDEGDDVHIHGNGTIHFEEKDIHGRLFDYDGKYNYYKPSTLKAIRAIRAITISLLGIGALVSYMVVGSLFPECWSYLWTLIFIPFVVDSVFSCILKRRVEPFNIVFLVVGIYLFLGLYLGLWHPTWVIFFAIPLFYAIASTIDTSICGKKWHFHQVIDSDDYIGKEDQD